MRIVTLSLMAIAAVLLTPGAASAHGDLDQTLEGDPGCNPFNIPVPVTQAGGQRQEFVPSQPGLSSVGVCTSPDAGPTEIDIIIREGSASSPGAVIGGGSVVVSATDFNHVDFLSVIPVDVGETYVIELAADLPITWHGTAPGEGAYIYDAGASNMPGTVQDFAFRTYSGAAPATSTPVNTPTRTVTRTRTPSVTPSPTLTPAAPFTTTTTPIPPANTTPPPTVGATNATPPPAARTSAPATSTRTSGVLGGARRTGTIRLPDVGDGSSTGAPPAWPLMALTGVTLLLAGLAARIRPSG